MKRKDYRREAAVVVIRKKLKAFQCRDLKGISFGNYLSASNLGRLCGGGGGGGKKMIKNSKKF
jgi:hypothetical protein